MAQPNSIDNVVNQQERQNLPVNASPNNFNNHNENLEAKVNNHEDKDDGGWNFKQIAKDVLKFSPFFAFNFLASGGLGFLAGAKTFWQASSSLASPLGYAAANWIGNKKKKKKTTWYETRKELGTGNFIGTAAYWLYQFPEYLVKASNLNTNTWYGQILKTMAFNPLMFVPFLAVYMPLVYIRDKIGTKKALKKPWKIPGYLKEAYHEDMKKNYWPTLRKSSWMLFPSHYLTIGRNLVSDPAYRVGIGAVHDVVFRLVAGGEAENGKEKVRKPSLLSRVKNFSKSLPEKISNFYRLPEKNADNNVAYST